jgi:hypothetical protein
MFQLISWALSTIVTAVITHELLPNYVIDFPSQPLLANSTTFVPGQVDFQSRAYTAFMRRDMIGRATCVNARD